MNDIQLVVNETIISGSDILSAIDAVLVHLEETGDLQVAENALKSLNQKNQRKKFERKND